MKKQSREAKAGRRNWTLAAMLGLATLVAGAQAPVAPAPSAPPVKPRDSSQDSSSKKLENHITAEQAKELFALVDQLTVYQNLFLRREKLFSPLPFVNNALMKVQSGKSAGRLARSTH